MGSISSCQDPDVASPVGIIAIVLAIAVNAYLWLFAGVLFRLPALVSVPGAGQLVLKD